jgi:hypothetical protein
VGDGGWRLGFGKRLGRSKRAALDGVSPSRRRGGATGGGGEIRPMAVVDNFMKIGKGSGSFVTNKLK